MSHKILLILLVILFYSPIFSQNKNIRIVETTTTWQTNEFKQSDRSTYKSKRYYFTVGNGKQVPIYKDFSNIKPYIKDEKAKGLLYESMSANKKANSYMWGLYGGIGVFFIGVLTYDSIDERFNTLINPITIIGLGISATSFTLSKINKKKFLTRLKQSASAQNNSQSSSQIQQLSPDKVKLNWNNSTVGIGLEWNF